MHIEQLVVVLSRCSKRRMSCSKIVFEQISKADAQCGALRCVHLKPHLVSVTKTHQKTQLGTEQWLQAGVQDVRRQQCLYLRNRAASRNSRADEMLLHT